MKAVRAFAIALLMPSGAFAQDTDNPTIQLAPMTPSAPVSPSAPQTSSEASEDTGEAPRIDLAPMTAGEGQPAAVAPPEPLDRDGAGPGLPGETAAASLPPEGWLVALSPSAQNIPTEVRIGGSMPTPRVFRLSGEEADAAFSLTLPEGAPPPTELRLSLRSSVNVLPDTSTLAVQINGTDAGVITLDGFGDFSEKVIETTALVPGVNSITLRAVQAHRIFCGPDASFAVWTEVDLGNSGILIDPAAIPLNADGFLAAMKAQVARGGAVEIVADETTDAGLIREVASRVTHLLGGAPRLEVIPFYAMQSGPEARARIALISADEPRASVRRGAGGAVVLQVEHVGDTGPDISAMLPDRLNAPNVPMLAPGEVTTLQALGSADILANTHYFRRDIDFRLPDDWLLLASQKAEFNIHYGFSAGLAQGALLLVKINGETIRLLPLDRDGGEILPPLSISFRANLLNPGINTLTLEMTVPGDPPDLPCTPRTTDMLVVLADSNLNVPPSPKMQQADMLRGLSRVGGASVVVPNASASSSALLAFGALLQPLVADDVTAQLNIVSLDTVGLVPTGQTEVTRRMLQDAVYPSLASSGALPSVAQPVPASPGFRLAPAAGGQAASPAPAAPAPASEAADRALGGAGSWVSQKLAELRAFMLPGAVSLEEWLQGKSGEALLLQLDPDTPNDIWLIAGPNIAMTDLARQVDTFRRSARSDTHVQAALLQADRTWITWSEMRRPELLEPLTLRNMRTVLGNYASWSPLTFTALTLILALLSIIPALLFVLMTRRSGSRT